MGDCCWQFAACALRGNELQIVIGDHRFLGADVEILKRVKALLEMLDAAPVIIEERENEERGRDRKAGLQVLY